MTINGKESETGISLSVLCNNTNHEFVLASEEIMLYSNSRHCQIFGISENHYNQIIKIGWKRNR